MGNTKAVPVGTIRKFVSQQYLNDYKTNTLDPAYRHPSTHPASMILFSDGQTFQQKLENGSLRGQQGAPGAAGAPGPKGEKGDKGDPGTSGSSNWNDIQNKPSSFTPSSHSHGEYLPKAGGTVTGDINLDSNNTSSRSFFTNRIGNGNKKYTGFMNVSFHSDNTDAGAGIAIGIKNTTDNKFLSSLVLTSRHLYSEATGIEIGKSDARFEKVWLNKLDVKENIFTSGSLTSMSGLKMHNCAFLNGYATDGRQFNLMCVDQHNNINLGWENQTFINMNNTMRVYRDIHVQEGAGIYVNGGFRIGAPGQYCSLGLGNNYVRLEYAVGDAVYVAGSETQSNGYGTPFRASQLESVNGYVKFGGHRMYVGANAPGGPNTGDVWVQV